jgi:hypothetical protein
MLHQGIVQLSKARATSLLVLACTFIDFSVCVKIEFFAIIAATSPALSFDLSKWLRGASSLGES